MSEYNFKGGYYDGAFHEEKPALILTDISPWNKAVLCQWYATAVTPAVQSAKEAFPKWRDCSLSERIHFLKKYQNLLIQNQAIGIELISREAGKIQSDAQSEWQSMIKKIDWTINISLKRIESINIENGECVFLPRGVAVVLGPFNFPGHLPNGQIIPALLSGNTVIFKPSEYAPLVGQLITQLFHEAGLPKGVFNLVQGGSDMGVMLVQNPEVSLVLFTGSYEVGKLIAEHCMHNPNKLAALEMGGMNVAVIHEDADLKQAVHECIDGAFKIAGQRCTATRKILLHKKVWQKGLTLFQEQIAGLKLGKSWDDQDAFCGPLVNKKALLQYQQYRQDMAHLKTECITPNFLAESNASGFFAVPVMHFFQDGHSFPVLKNEIFFPALQMESFENLSQVQSVIHQTGYGLSASIFCKERLLFQEFRKSIQVGCVNWNRSTAGASSELPFGGLGRSGNARPAGIMMIDACVYPVASLWNKLK